MPMNIVLIRQLRSKSLPSFGGTSGNLGAMGNHYLLCADNGNAPAKTFAGRQSALGKIGADRRIA